MYICKAIPPSSTDYITSGLDLYIDHWREVFLTLFLKYKVKSNQYFRSLGLTFKCDIVREREREMERERETERETERQREMYYNFRLGDSRNQRWTLLSMYRKNSLKSKIWPSSLALCL